VTALLHELTLEYMKRPEDTADLTLTVLQRSILFLV
jgi:hypothetical protein